MADVFSQFSLDMHDGQGRPISLCSEGDEEGERSVSAESWAGPQRPGPHSGSRVARLRAYVRVVCAARLAD